MSCSACSAHVEKAVSKVPGVNSVQVNLLQNSMVVDYDEAATNDQAIIRAVEEGGYGASVKGEEKAEEPNAVQKKAEEEARKMKTRLGSFHWFSGSPHVHFHGTYARMASPGDFVGT